MSDRMTNHRGHDAGDKPHEDQPAATPTHEHGEHDEREEKSGMHRTSPDPRKQIPATEGGEA